MESTPEKPNDKAEIEALIARLTALENQVRGTNDILRLGMVTVESQGKTNLETFKWALSIFTVLALAFAGFNWWSGKANYERDKETLKANAELMEKKTAVSHTEWVMTADKQLAEMRNQTQTNVQTLFAFREKQLGETLASFTNDLKTLSDAMIQTNRVSMSNTVASLTKSGKRAEGLTLFVQGVQFCKDNKCETPNQFALLAGGIKSLAGAASDLSEAEDEANLRKCLGRLTEYLTVLISNAKPEHLALLDAGMDFTGELDSVIAICSKSDAKLYESELFQLRAFRREIFRLTGRDGQNKPQSKP